MIKLLRYLKRLRRARRERCPFCGSKEWVPREKTGLKQIIICTVCNNCWINKDGKITKVLDDDAENELQEFMKGFFGDD